MTAHLHKIIVDIWEWCVFECARGVRADVKEVIVTQLVFLVGSDILLNLWHCFPIQVTSCNNRLWTKPFGPTFGDNSADRTGLLGGHNYNVCKPASTKAMVDATQQNELSKPQMHSVSVHLSINTIKYYVLDLALYSPHKSNCLVVGYSNYITQGTTILKNSVGGSNNAAFSKHLYVKPRSFVFRHPPSST